MKELFNRFRKYLYQPEDISLLVFFRIAFGALMFWEMFRYFAAGRIEAYWVNPPELFRFEWFEWLPRFPGWAVQGLWVLLWFLAFFIMLGFLYRISMLLFALIFTWFFVQEQSVYLNHFYLICLISWIMVFLPAHRAFSVDAWLFKRIRRRQVPRWCRLWLVFQVSIVYVFGGIAKINYDWLIYAMPMRDWTRHAVNLPIIGPHAGEVWFAYLFSWGGMLFDLLIAPLLLCRRTRWLGATAALLFHLTNSEMFTIGVFPWFMIATIGLYFSPDWPRKLVGRIKSLFRKGPPTAPAVVPSGRKTSVGFQVAMTGFLVVWAAFQIGIPLRHWFIPGRVAWTEEGHKFSWRMKLRDKESNLLALVDDPKTGKHWRIEPGVLLVEKQAGEVGESPDMILKFSHMVAKQFAREGYPEVAVRVWSEVSLNGRPWQNFVDSTVNLAAIKTYEAPVSWILPFKNTVPVLVAESRK